MKTHIMLFSSEIRIKRKFLGVVQNLKKAGYAKEEVLEFKKFNKELVDQVFG